MKIRFNSADDVAKFVCFAEKLSFQLDISKDGYVVDGKSMMGIFTIGLGHKLELTLHTDNIDDIDYVVRFLSETKFGVDNKELMDILEKHGKERMGA